MMSAGNDLVVIFLGLETLSIATYVMAGLRKRRPQIERIGDEVFHPRLVRLGISALRNGADLRCDRLDEPDGDRRQESPNPNFPALLLVGGAMMIIGFGFKIAMAPFHVWTPDVYEGAPTPITGFMAAGPKAAAFASFLRVFVLGLPLVAGCSGVGLSARIVDHGTCDNGDAHDDRRQRRRDHAEQRQANACVFVDRSRRLRARRICRSRVPQDDDRTRTKQLHRSRSIC